MHSQVRPDHSQSVCFGSLEIDSSSSVEASLPRTVLLAGLEQVGESCCFSEFGIEIDISVEEFRIVGWVEPDGEETEERQGQVDARRGEEENKKDERFGSSDDKRSGFDDGSSASDHES